VNNQGMLIDLYHLTMAQGFQEQGKAGISACFYMHFRDNPFQGGYTVACGTDHLAELINDFFYEDDDIAYLSTLDAPSGGKLFTPCFLEVLRNLKLSVDIDAVRDGTLVFPYEPILRVTGPIIDCQIVEAALLNAVNFESLIATKAARVCQVANGPVSEFGLRRAQGPNGGILASRAAYVGGCSSTSNVAAGKRFGIPVSGTHAHSWVMTFDDELEAFRAYVDSFPHNAILLVDTYSVEQGTAHAITVAREMRERGECLMAIRIDSGDLAWGSRKARSMLDEAGFPEVKIVATNDLDEYTIASLLDQGAAIDMWGVGTKLVTAFDQPALGGVYKLSALRKAGSDQWEPRIKVSDTTGKRTLPGLVDARRYYDAEGNMMGDMIFDEQGVSESRITDPHDPLRRKDLSSGSFEPLLHPLVRQGRSVVTSDVEAARLRATRDLARLDQSRKRFLNPHSYPVGLSHELHTIRDTLILSLIER
jgi:nicotinate phosphoribosyltransferase